MSLIITIINYINGVKVETVAEYNVNITFEQMDELHDEYSKANPTSWVNMSIGDGEGEGSFIMGMREQQRVDEELLDLKLITWDEFTERNYGKL